MARAPTSREGPEAVVDQIVKLSRKVDPDGHARTLGVGVAGVVSGGGTVVAASNLVGWSVPVELGAMLRRCTPSYVSIINDATASTLAEHQWGNGRGFDDFFAVAVGTGVGGGLVLDGQLRVGPHGVTGEIGHTLIDPEGPACACGQRGHLEAYLGRRALERRARSVESTGRTSLLFDMAGAGRMTSEHWRKASEQGDAVALELLEDAARALAVALSNVLAIVDFERVVVAGGFVSRLGDRWLDTVRERHAPSGVAGVSAEILGSGIGDNAAAIGAALSCDVKRANR